MCNLYVLELTFWCSGTYTNLFLDVSKIKLSTTIKSKGFCLFSILIWKTTTQIGTSINSISYSIEKTCNDRLILKFGKTTDF